MATEYDIIILIGKERWGKLSNKNKERMKRMVKRVYLSPIMAMDIWRVLKEIKEEE